MLNFRKLLFGEKKIIVTLDPKNRPVRIYDAKIQNWFLGSRLILSFDTPMSSFDTSEWFFSPLILEVKDSKGNLLKENKVNDPILFRP